eukprot:Gregarina_sp_Poly_1__4787@NODE_2551_length_1994_cov_829_254281_g1620_i0_p1_GENE_NODE_2551_length_1994_cov_829_254281_g1620_i0NODE_2551_length_1994_cov_829_254281_g1620_i0_p1_ORF_typecomplete_len353_score55_12ADH_N_2/PF16884_5/3_7e29ADH_zinc_N/PF00107_26/4_9e23ADH_zinc_N_2/PF13602_6/2_5e07DUF2855/PF11017_8/0_79DUF2855/PF11017_8/3_7e02_NODE_2551_length_1994_cov_829_254281_g1620_i0471105
MTNSQVVLKHHIPEVPDADRDFDCVSVDDYDETTTELSDDEVLLKLEYLSMDPYLRGRMREIKGSYAASFNPGEPITGFGIAQVLKSGNPSFQKGDFVQGMFPWKSKFVYKITQDFVGFGLQRLPSPSPVPLSFFLGTLGMPGLTAWLGFHKLCEPKEGETLFVSAACGAVGQIVGQLGKQLGLTVVGSVGSDDKVKLAKEKFGYDEVINYKTCGSLEKALMQVCPKGIDCYFDNVGGDMLDAVLAVCNRHCRIAVCGAISVYNADPAKVSGIKNYVMVIGKAITIRGFLVNDLVGRYGATEATTSLMDAVVNKEIQVLEDVVEAPINRAPEVFIRMMTGANMGKQVLKLTE